LFIDADEAPQVRRKNSLALLKSTAESDRQAVKMFPATCHLPIDSIERLLFVSRIPINVRQQCEASFQRPEKAHPVLAGWSPHWQSRYGVIVTSIKY
jgi:hypothetical protein